MLKIHPLPEDIPATKEPTNKTYEPKVMQGVDAPFPFTVPDSDHRILYKRHTIGDGNSLYYAISLIRAFRRGENINEKDLEVKMGWLKTSLLENLSNYVNRAKDKQLISEYKTESDIREILNSEWANTDVAAIAAQFLRNDITIIGRDEGDPGHATVFTYSTDFRNSKIAPYYIFFDGAKHFEALLSTIELPALQRPPNINLRRCTCWPSERTLSSGSRTP
eukprot:jgi/Mesvir1/9585/Mv04893-RA.1